MRDDPYRAELAAALARLEQIDHPERLCAGCERRRAFYATVLATPRALGRAIVMALVAILYATAILSMIVSFLFGGILLLLGVCVGVSGLLSGPPSCGDSKCFLMSGPHATDAIPILIVAAVFALVVVASGYAARALGRMLTK